MSLDRFQSLAPYIAAGTLALALVLFAISLRYFRKSRTDFYWRRRRAAGQRGSRIFVWALGLTLCSGAACTVTAVSALIKAGNTNAKATAAAAILDTNTPAAAKPTSKGGVPGTPTAPGTQDSIPLATSTAQLVVLGTPTFTPSAAIPVTKIPLRSPTHSPTPTNTLTPTTTPTPSETLVPARLITATLSSSVTPGPSAKLNITALDTQISADFAPVSPGTTFTAGFNRIYFFVKFSGLQNGVLWRRVLLHDGTILEDSSYLWGSAAGDNIAGTAYFFFGQEGGFKSGKYEIRLYIGQTDKPATTAAFTVN